MADNDDKLLQINRIRHFDGDEEYMLERENRDLGAKFMEYLRHQDTPVVVEVPETPEPVVGEENAEDMWFYDD